MASNIVHAGIKDNQIISIYYAGPPEVAPEGVSIVEKALGDPDVVSFLNRPPGPNPKALVDLMLTPVEDGGLVDLYLTIKSVDKAAALLLQNALTITWNGGLSKTNKIAAIQDAINDVIAILQSEGVYTDNRSRIEQALIDTNFDSLITLPPIE
jgi:hypothetical protein